jgi:ferrochelatase
MKISSIVDIVSGQLQNTPAISFITQAHTDISKISDGDIYISSDIQNIHKAIVQGAFTIIYDCNLDLSNLNDEIAYIKVQDIKQSCIKLLRYKLSNTQIDVLNVDNISFELFKLYKIQHNNCLYLEDDILKNFENIQNKHNIQTIISTNKKLLNDIYPKNCDFKIPQYDISNLIVHSLFETSFSYKKRYFYKLKLPLIYIEHFISVIEFLDIQNIDTNKLKDFGYMRVIFINKSNHIVPYGGSNRFIIANSCKNTNSLELEFLKKIYSYGTIKIIEDDISLEKEIFQIIKQQDFNALYIKSKTYDEILQILKNNDTSPLELF